MKQTKKLTKTKKNKTKQIYLSLVRLQIFSKENTEQLIYGTIPNVSLNRRLGHGLQSNL